MKNFIKRLFCKHEYETIEITNGNEDIGGILEIVEIHTVKKCKKCGKVIRA